MPANIPRTLLTLLFIAAHIYVMVQIRREKKGVRSALRVSGLTRVLGVLLAVADTLIIGICVLLLVIFTREWYMVLLIILGGLLLDLLLIGLMFRWFSKNGFLLWLACGLLVFGTLGGIELRKDYLKRITLKEQFDYRTYMPFQGGSLVKTLEEPPALRFQAGDKLPRMDGATALYPVYAAFCQAVYPDSLGELSRSDLEKSVITCSTTSSAYKSIVEGDRDIIFVAGPSQEQEKYAAERGVKLVYTPIGREAFVFFVNPKNPLEDVSLEEIRKVYSGQITRWEELGVRGLGEILAYQREEGSGSQTALRRFVMGDTPLMPADKEETVDGMGDIIKRVSEYQNRKNALGFSFRFYSTVLTKGFDVKLLKINGAAPTAENIENGSYPLASAFYAVTRSDADENTLALLEWIQSPQGQALVAETGYTPLSTRESQR